MKTSSLKLLMDGKKNTVAQITGFASLCGRQQILRLDALSDKPKRVKINAFLYSFVAKIPAILSWQLPGGIEVICPLEGRGKLNFEDFHGMPAPEDAEGIVLDYNADSNNPFLLIFDLEKT